MPRYLIPAFFLLALAAPVAARIAPIGDAPVAILAPALDGGATAARVVAAAGGTLVEVARGGMMVIARSDAPGFVRRLYAAGALLVVTAEVGACGPSRSARIL